MRATRNKEGFSRRKTKQLVDERHPRSWAKGGEEGQEGGGLRKYDVFKGVNKARDTSDSTLHHSAHLGGAAGVFRSTFVRAAVGSAKGVYVPEFHEHRLRTLLARPFEQMAYGSNAALKQPVSLQLPKSSSYGDIET